MHNALRADALPADALQMVSRGMAMHSGSPKGLKKLPALKLLELGDGERGVPSVWCLEDNTAHTLLRILEIVHRPHFRHVWRLVLDKTAVALICLRLTGKVHEAHHEAADRRVTKPVHIVDDTLQGMLVQHSG